VISIIYNDSSEHNWAVEEDCSIDDSFVEGREVEQTGFNKLTTPKTTRNTTQRHKEGAVRKPTNIPEMKMSCRNMGRHNICVNNELTKIPFNVSIVLTQDQRRLNSIQFIYIAPNYNNCHLKALK